MAARHALWKFQVSYDYQHVWPFSSGNVQDTDHEDQRHADLVLLGHLKIPDGLLGQQKHDDVRDEIDSRCGDVEPLDADAVAAGD